MKRVEVSGAVRPIYESLGVKRIMTLFNPHQRMLKNLPQSRI